MTNQKPKNFKEINKGANSAPLYFFEDYTKFRVTRRFQYTVTVLLPAKNLEVKSTFISAASVYSFVRLLNI